MNVRELIEALGYMDPESTVYFRRPGTTLTCEITSVLGPEDWDGPPWVTPGVSLVER